MSVMLFGCVRTSLYLVVLAASALTLFPDAESVLPPRSRTVRRTGHRNLRCHAPQTLAHLESNFALPPAEAAGPQGAAACPESLVVLGWLPVTRNAPAASAILPPAPGDRGPPSSL